jgi:hypothetical protein
MKHKLMTEAAVAEYLGVSLYTTRRWRRRENGDFPVYLTMPGGKIAVTESALESWLVTRVTRGPIV